MLIAESYSNESLISRYFDNIAIVKKPFRYPNFAGSADLRKNDSFTAIKTTKVDLSLQHYFELHTIKAGTAENVNALGAPTSVINA